MTDIYDQATEHEERHRAASLAAQARKAPLVGDWKTLSAKWCEGEACGERIPDERRKAVPGVKLCVDCQEMAEELKRRGRA